MPFRRELTEFLSANMTIDHYSNLTPDTHVKVFASINSIDSDACISTAGSRLSACLFVELSGWLTAWRVKTRQA